MVLPGQRKEEKKNEDQKEKVSEERRSRCEKVGKSRNALFFQPGGAMWSDERWQVARRCGAKHISNSKPKCTKHLSSGALLEVEMLKECAPLWPKAHFEVKMHKAPHVREVEMSNKCTPLWREAHFQIKNLQNTTCTRHFCTLKRRFAWQEQGIVHLVKSEQNVRAL